MARGVAVSPSLGVLLKDLGIPPADLLRQAGLPADLLAQGSITLSPERYFDLWRALEALSDQVLPVAIGQAISVEAFEPPLFAALCSPDLLTAAQRIARYKALMSPLQLDLEGALSITFRWPLGLEAPPGLNLMELVFWTALARLGTREKVTPARITAPVLPQDMATYTEFLGRPIEPGPEFTLHFAEADAPS